MQSWLRVMYREITTARWLPIEFMFNRASSLVRWIDFGTKYLSEPFFHDTIEYLRGSNLPAQERATSIDLFLDAATATPMVLPSGIIFHVTRCGSTLLANVLKAGEPIVTLSEAPLLAPFFGASPFEGAPSLTAISNNTRKTFLDALVRLYAQYGATSVNAKVLIKCDSFGILGMSLIRQSWPTVPFVILIRDPVEVMVSNLNLPAGWFVMRRHTSEFGWTSKESENMLPEEYMARIIGRLYDVVLERLDDKCRVIDYSMLNKPTLLRIADWFDINTEGILIEEVLRRDAKASNNSKIFEADTGRKQRSASPLAREYARKWAYAPYHRLRALALTQLDSAPT